MKTPRVLAQKLNGSQSIFFERLRLVNRRG